MSTNNNRTLGDCLTCTNSTLSSGMDALTAAVELRIGKPVPPDHVIVHLCGNKDCVNPYHLTSDTTTRLEGILLDDTIMYVPPVGENNVNSKLTAGDVELIMQLVRDEIPQRTIATRFGVTQQTISRIVTGTTWNHVTGIPRPSPDQLWRKLTGDDEYPPTTRGVE